MDDGKKDEVLHTLQLELENLKLNLTEKESSIGRLVSINPSVVFIYCILLIISVSVQYFNYIHDKNRFKNNYHVVKKVALSLTWKFHLPLEQ